MVYNYVAQIPFKKYDFNVDDVITQTEPTDNNTLIPPVKKIAQQLIEQFDLKANEFITSIQQTTGQRFIATNGRKARQTKYNIYMKCCQDQSTLNKRQKKKVTYLKRYDCESYLTIKFNVAYRLIEIYVSHNQHHGVLDSLPVPNNLEGYIKDNDYYIYSNLKNKLRSMDEYSTYVNYPTTKHDKVLKDLWLKNTAVKWQK